MAGLNETPSGNRLHIGVFGKTNSGKSSFINRFSGQNISIVADVAGTTTDPVYKAMEVYPLGPCTLIDTAGFNDETELGEERLEKTKLAAEKTDIAIILLTDIDMDEELHWYEYFREKKTSVIWVIGKADIRNDTEKINEKLYQQTGQHAVIVSAATGAHEIGRFPIHSRRFFRARKGLIVPAGIIHFIPSVCCGFQVFTFHFALTIL